VTRLAPDSPAEPAGGGLRSGFLLCDKPAGLTSHDVVARARREHDGIRTGHAGTLDPFATGLLVVLLGGGTRLQRYVLGLPKSYEATARLGWRSTTGDPDGELTETGVIPDRLELPTGEVEQRVPMTSAVRVDGERLYKLAHRGEEAERPLRRVAVSRAELIGTGEGTATFAIDCSSGTYVRTLIEELGDAYCESLRRTAIGPLRIEDAGPEVRPVEELLTFLPEVVVDADDARLVRNGIRLEAPADAAEGPLRIVCEGELVAVARVEGDRLRTEMVLPF
jgi:tRNA pseudouridine55 synthase